MLKIDFNYFNGNANVKYILKNLDKITDEILEEKLNNIIMNFSPDPHAFSRINQNELIVILKLLQIIDELESELKTLKSPENSKDRELLRAIKTIMKYSKEEEK